MERDLGSSSLHIDHITVTVCLSFKTSLAADLSCQKEFDLHENEPIKG